MSADAAVAAQAMQFRVRTTSSTLLYSCNSVQPTRAALSLRRCEYTASPPTPQGHKATRPQGRHADIVSARSAVAICHFVSCLHRRSRRDFA